MSNNYILESPEDLTLDELSDMLDILNSMGYDMRRLYKSATSSVKPQNTQKEETIDELVERLAAGYP